MRKALLLLFLFFSFWMLNAQCDPPVALSANPGSASVEVSCIPMGNTNSFGIYIVPANQPGPSSSQYPDLIFDGTSAHLEGLQCETGYAYYACSMCSDGISAWAGPYYFYTQACFQFGIAQTLSACPFNGEVCFDLHQNDANILNGGSDDDPFFDVLYYTNLDDFQNQTNDVDSVCLSSGSATIYVNAFDYWTQQTYSNAFQISVREDCDGIRMNAFVDGNNNGIKDAGENYFPFGQFSYQLQGEDPHVITTATGFYKIADTDETHVYDLGFSIPAAYADYYAIPTAAYANINPAPIGFLDVNFPIVPTASFHDATVSLTRTGGPIPGGTHRLTVTYTNTGNQPESGTVVFTKAPVQTIAGASPSQGGSVTLTETGFNYHFSNLAPLQNATIAIDVQTPPIPTVALGDYVYSSVSVQIEDAISESISAFMNLEIRGSHDPNDKMEAHGRDIESAAFSSDDDLTYTIRFENTGNAAAQNIKITDTLDAQLDASTVRMVASSHNVVLDRVGQNLTWRFNGIDLPPVSDIDPQQGHGYLTFAVQPTNFAVGDVIPNDASIYFDFNPAIVTNTFETHFVETLGVKAFDNRHFTLFPNPAYDKISIASADANIESVAVFDVSGKRIQFAHFGKSSLAVLDVSGLQSGMYFVKVMTDSGSTTTQKLIKK